jgi:hypothetical protein
MIYKGETQASQYACVFANVGAAINSVSNKNIWTQHTLFAEWEKTKSGDANFSNLFPIAIEPVKSQIKVHHHMDDATAISNANYLNMVQSCVDEDGVAIVSLEHADGAGNRKKSWHNLSLIGRQGDIFEAWDSADGIKIPVSAEQLVDSIPYKGGVLALHDKHEVLLVCPAS